MMRRVVGATVAFFVLAAPVSAGGPEGGDTPGSGPYLTWKDVGPGAFHTSGNTSDNTNAGTACAADGPDVWYTVDLTDAPQPYQHFTLNVNMCSGVGFNAKTYVLDDQGEVVECGGCALNTGVSRGVYEIAVDGDGPSDAGIFNGSISIWIPYQNCPLDPPCHGDAEGEPCDELVDTINGGCNSTPEAFGSITLDGPAVCGTTWAVGGTRDTDWFSFSLTETTPIELELRSEVPCVTFLAQMSPGGVCPVIAIPDGTPIYGDACKGVHEVGGDYLLEPGDYIVFVGVGCPLCGPGVISGLPCSDGPGGNGHGYEVFLRTGPLPPAPCPWDVNENGDVDFADILAVIANWGPCPQ